MLYTTLPEHIREIVKTYPEDWSDTQIFTELCAHLNTPFIKVLAHQIDLKALKDYSFSKCKELQFLPLFRGDVMCVVAVTRPWLQTLKREITDIIYDDIRFVAIDPDNFDQIVQDLELELSKKPVVIKSNNVLEPIYGFGEVVSFTEIIREIVRRMHAAEASDIHFEPMEDRLVIRYRWNGELRFYQAVELKYKNQIIDAIKTLAMLPNSDRVSLKDSRFSVKTTNDYKVNLRLVALPTPYGENIVLRILDPEKVKSLMGKLPFRSNDLELFNSCINREQGLIVLSGPTGSGKTTTLYSSLLSLDLARWNIRTVEDPIEYVLPKIIQTEVDQNNGVTTSAALSKILRADPDVILVGETRDEETAKLAISAANTGHLVFTTLHTNDAVSIISRLEELGISKSQTIENLTLGVAQRLLRLNCKHCLIEDPMTPRVQAHLQHYNLYSEKLQLFKSCGCKHCHNTGVGGRTPIFQFLYVDDNIRNAITNGATPDEIRRLNAANHPPVIVDALKHIITGDSSYIFASSFETTYIS